MAAQQGAYIARLLNRRYLMSQLPSPVIPKTLTEFKKAYIPTNSTILTSSSSSSSTSATPASYFTPPSQQQKTDNIPYNSSVSDSHLLFYRSNRDKGPLTWDEWQWQTSHLGSQLRVRGATEAKPFQFLNLGLLAYVGGEEAVAQVQCSDRNM